MSTRLHPRRSTQFSLIALLLLLSFIAIDPAIFGRLYGFILSHGILSAIALLVLLGLECAFVLSLLGELDRGIRERRELAERRR